MVTSTGMIVSYDIRVSKTATIKNEDLVFLKLNNLYMKIPTQWLEWKLLILAQYRNFEIDANTLRNN